LAWFCLCLLFTLLSGLWAPGCLGPSVLFISESQLPEQGLTHSGCSTHRNTHNHIQAALSIWGSSEGEKRCCCLKMKKNFRHRV
jgi:hypothetical protein